MYGLWATIALTFYIVLSASSPQSKDKSPIFPKHLVAASVFVGSTTWCNENAVVYISVLIVLPRHSTAKYMATGFFELTDIDKV